MVRMAYDLTRLIKKPVKQKFGNDPNETAHEFDVKEHSNLSKLTE